MSKLAAVFLSLVLVTVAAGRAAAGTHPHSVPAATHLSVVAPLVIAPASVTAFPRPDHVVVVVMENHSAATVLGNPAAP